MSSLKALQERMAKAIMNRDMQPIGREFTAGCGRPEYRLNIFANNTYVSLKACLKAKFPVTMKLADERFFEYAADAFVAKHPPREARLSHFGGEFPKFLAAFQACRDHPVIAEMAAMEWAIADMMNAPQLRPAPMSAIAEIARNQGDPGLELQPNLRFVISRWPLIETWHEHCQSGRTTMTPLVSAVTRTVITRERDDIHFLTAEQARFTFWRALARGFPIRVAAVRALAHDKLFDLVSEIALLFRLNLVTDVFSILPKGAMQ